MSSRLLAELISDLWHLKKDWAVRASYHTWCRLNGMLHCREYKRATMKAVLMKIFLIYIIFYPIFYLISLFTLTIFIFKIPNCWFECMISFLFLVRIHLKGRVRQFSDRNHKSINKKSLFICVTEQFLFNFLHYENLRMSGKISPRPFSIIWETYYTST